MSSAKQTVSHILSLADIKVDGDRPFDIKVHDARFYKSVISSGGLGLGESYMDSWWDVDHLDQFVARMMAANVSQQVKPSPAMIHAYLAAQLFNRQSVKRASRNAAYHYDIGNDLYERMLDKNMIYTCGYWDKASNLEDAQLAKLDLVCRKLQLEKGMTLLDLGCGWGGFAEYAAKNYGVIVTGVTPAYEQVIVAKQRTEGLPVTILQGDFRDVTGTFDRVAAIGLLEHVGPKNYRTLFTLSNKVLNSGGLMLFHTIGNNRSTKFVDPWIDRYIFPGGVIPSLAQISRAIEKLLIIEDLHNFGPDYDKTLMAWHHNFMQHYDELSDKYDERFKRMWNFYLLSCAGMFRARHMQLWQIVMRKIEPSAVYRAVR